MKQITKQDLWALWSMYTNGANIPTPQGFWDRLKIEYTAEEMGILSFPVFPPQGARKFDPTTVLTGAGSPKPDDPDDPEPVDPPEDLVDPPEDPIDLPDDCERMGWICPRCRGGVAPTIERCPCVSLCGK